MQSLPILNIIIIIFLAAEIGLLLYILTRRATDQARTQWLAGTILPIIVLTALQLLPNDRQFIANLGHTFFIWLGIIVLQIMYGGMIIHDISRDHTSKRLRTIWALLAAVWFVGFSVTALIDSTPFVGWSEWNIQAPGIAPFVGIGIGAVMNIYLLGVTFYYFYIAPMPEVANRSAFWTVTTAILLIAVTLLASSSPILMLPANLILFTALAIATYGIRHYRLADIRHSIIVVARTLAITLTLWTFSFGALYFVTRVWTLDSFVLPSATMNIVILAGIAIVVAALTIPARQIIERLFEQFSMDSRPSLANATSQYSQRVARAANLEEVVEATTETINKVMNVRRSALILINNTYRLPNAVELIVLENGATLNHPTSNAYISKSSSIFRTLAVEQVPLGQFDIEYGPTYLQAPPDERKFFKEMQMSAYVPVVADNRLLGILASGAKSNDMPYYREDVELLTVIGQQVGTALRSARLIDDLQHLNDSMRVLNKRLESAKMELEKLDSIKTDFITIASHELRTPLAQIRGYTDIIDSLNEADALKQEEAAQMVTNLRKSTERMEELISAMLDVSQIDVNSMDLRFVRTTPETVIRMALDPLQDPAKQRNIQIEHEGLTELPYIQADMQRMVQAFRNLILNAIKFTPDGGKISISGQLENTNGSSDDERILLSIKDTGVGIAKKDLEYIFQKFYRAFDTQLHSTGIYKFLGAGPGLGLTIAKGIIEGHGGEIWAESPGHDMENLPGTTFYVRIPVHPPEGARRVSPFVEDEQATKPATKSVPDDDDTQAQGDELSRANTRIPRTR